MKKILKIIRVISLILFISGLFIISPWSWHVYPFGSDETFIASITSEMMNNGYYVTTVDYHFLPIKLVGDQMIFTFYLVYICFPTAISCLFFIVSNYKLQKYKYLRYI